MTPLTPSSGRFDLYLKRNRIENFVLWYGNDTTVWKYELKTLSDNLKMSAGHDTLPPTSNAKGMGKHRQTGSQTMINKFYNLEKYDEHFLLSINITT